MSQQQQGYRWNNWAGALGRVILIVVYVPLFSIMLVPWLCLALVTWVSEPLFSGFFHALASTGWLVASGAAWLFVVYVLVSSAIRRRRERRRAGR